MKKEPDIDKEDLGLSVVPFKPRLAFSTGGETPGGPWLSNLAQGDVFLAKVRTVDKWGNSQEDKRNFELNQFEILYRTEKSVKIRIMVADQDRSFVRWVDPAVFSKEVDFHELIGNRNDIEEE